MQNVEWAEQITNSILAHYDAHARELPWRSMPNKTQGGGNLPDPYHVWLSEIMLQQTTVTAVKPYFTAFTARWPTLAALAASEDADVMAAWAGLGYYARARNLLACARKVVSDFGGRFPEDEASLRTLPGIGEYTAAAISSIAFGRRAVVVDGNVERVIARFHAVEEMMPKAKLQIKALTDALTPNERAGDFAQAMMDIGARICIPKAPRCLLCPLERDCQGKGDPLSYPVKLAKAAKPHRTGTAYWIERDGQVLLVRRPSKGLLGGMLALPSTDWKAGADQKFEAGWKNEGQVHHIFTHFSLVLTVCSKRIQDQDAPFDGAHQFWPIDGIEDAGLPSLFLKAAQLVIGQKD
jgi:A/G-specific adenine glycosylase